MGGISSKRQRRRHAGIRWRRACLKEWQSGGVSAETCARATGPRNMTTADTAQASSLFLLAHAQLPRPVHAFLYPETRATPAQHNYAYQIMHPPPSGEYRNYLLTLPSAYSPELLHNCRGMNCTHARFIPLMTLSCYFPNCPSCSACYSSTHYLTLYVFLFVSVNPEAEMASHDETATQNQPAG